MTGDALFIEDGFYLRVVINFFNRPVDVADYGSQQHQGYDNGKQLFQVDAVSVNSSQPEHAGCYYYQVIYPFCKNFNSDLR